MEIPIHNPGKNPLPVGNLTVLPGETRLIEERLVPPHLRPQQEAESVLLPEDPVLALLERTVPEIVAHLPALSDEDYEGLKEAERNGNTRVTLVKAFSEEDLRRANAEFESAQAPAGGDADSASDSAANEQHPNQAE